MADLESVNPVAFGNWDQSNVDAVLQLNAIAADHYRCRCNEANLHREIFGGQFIAQALQAALLTGAGRAPHAMHGFFLSGGDSAQPLDWQVDRLRDGRSFGHRRVSARQGASLRFVADVSLHDAEHPSFAHQVPMPQVPPPESLRGLHQLAIAHRHVLGDIAVERITRKTTVEQRPIDPEAGLLRPGTSSRSQCWIRVNQPLPRDDLLQHAVLLAYLSDYWGNAAARVLHTANLFDRSLAGSSLNHGLWFHQLKRADDWLLFDTQSPAASGGLGLTRGAIYHRDGELLASFTQEALMRAPRS